MGRFQVGKTGKTLIDAGLIEKALELIELFVTQESNVIDKNFRREKQWLYPFEALRELMINALAHRDWTRFVDVEIAGYQDRLEITSPGALPHSMTIEKVVVGQRSARNTILVEVLRDYGFVDARGMGMRTKVVPALKASGAKWTMEATGDFVKTIVGKAGTNGHVAETDRELMPAKSGKPQKSAGKTSGKILEACRESPFITIPE